MLTVYCFSDGRVNRANPVDGEPMPAGTFWIDLLEPDEHEETLVETITGIDIPTPEEMREIETTSRLYREGLNLFMTASILNRAETLEPETRAVTFILVNGVLVTLRYCEPLPFRTFQSRVQTHPEYCVSAEMALVELLDAIVDRIADTLEMVDSTVGSMSRAIFAPPDDSRPTAKDYRGELKSIGVNAVRCSRVDESLVGLSRLLIFLDANLRQTGHKQVRTRIKDLQRDISSLSGYVERLSEKLQLMLDATLGLINIQQNGTIKIFSVVAVVFLPPTLIASIYGMNFEIMPELGWPWGYPFALALMVVSAILPYWFFKRRGWL
jgi:magnesium transporter